MGSGWGGAWYLSKLSMNSMNQGFSSCVFTVCGVTSSWSVESGFVGDGGSDVCWSVVGGGKYSIAGRWG